MDFKNCTNKSNIDEQILQSTMFMADSEASKDESNETKLDFRDVSMEKESSKVEVDNSAHKKECIEILKVELVAPGGKLFNIRETEANINAVEEDSQGKCECKEKVLVEKDVDEKVEQSISAEKKLIDNGNEKDPECNDCSEKGLKNEKLLEILSTAPSGLSLLAQYKSDNEMSDSDLDSDSDSVIEVATLSTKDYRNQVVEINSDSDSESSDSDIEYLKELRKTIDKRLEVTNEDDDEDEEENAGKKKNKSKLKVKGELSLEDLPPIEDLKITVPEDECIEFGKVHSIVDQLVLVSALPNSILLDLETIIFLEKGKKVLGEVFDVLGQVADPLYCIRFNSNKHVKEKQINIGDVVYVAPKTQYTQYVILSNLMKLKGSDASWENDIEPPPRFLDYSDDEQEQLARRQLRNKERIVDHDDISKRPKITEDNDDSFSNKSKSAIQYVHQRNRLNEQRVIGRGNSGQHNYNSRQHNQQNRPYLPPNYYRNSWHSNYYPHTYPPRPIGNYRMAPLANPSHHQVHSLHMPIYPMPNLSQTSQYGGSSIIRQPGPYSLNIVPPTLNDSLQLHITPENPFTSGPPPPPGCQ